MERPNPRPKALGYVPQHAKGRRPLARLIQGLCPWIKVTALHTCQATLGMCWNEGCQHAKGLSLWHVRVRALERPNPRPKALGYMDEPIHNIYFAMQNKCTPQHDPQHDPQHKSQATLGFYGTIAQFMGHNLGQNATTQGRRPWVTYPIPSCQRPLAFG